MIARRIQSLAGSVLGKAGADGDLRGVIERAGTGMFIQITAAALSFASQVLLARWMGVFEFGVYVFAWSLVLPTAASAPLGLSSAATRFVPQYLSQEKFGLLRGLLRRSSMIGLSVASGILVCGWLVLDQTDLGLDDVYQWPLRLALLCLPPLAVVAVLSGASRGFSWAKLMYVPQLIMIPGLLLAGVGLFTLIQGPPSASATLSIAIVVCMGTAMTHWFVFRRALPATMSSTAPTYDTRLWIRVALPLFLSDGIFLILWNVDTVMLGAMLSPEDVSVYHASVRTAGLTLMVFNVVTAFAAPRFAALLVDTDLPSRQSFARSIARWMFWPTLFVVAVVMLLGKYALAIFGSEFTVGQPALLILAAGYLLQSVTGPVSAYLAVSNNQDSVVVINASAAVSNIVLNLFLIPLWGVVGAAVSSVASIVLAQVWSYFLVRQRLSINSLAFAREPRTDAISR